MSNILHYDGRAMIENLRQVIEFFEALEKARTEPKPKVTITPDTPTALFTGAAAESFRALDSLATAIQNLRDRARLNNQLLAKLTSLEQRATAMRNVLAECAIDISTTIHSFNNPAPPEPEPGDEWKQG